MARKYKKSKRYGRRKFRASKKRAGYKRLAKTIQRISGVEIKYASFSVAYNVFGPGWYNLGAVGKGILGTCLGQGVQNNQIIGNSVYVRKILVELQIGTDCSQNAPLLNPCTNQIPWMMRLCLIKPYNFTDFVNNFNSTVNPRLPLLIDTPIDWQTGKIVWDKTYKLSVSPNYQGVGSGACVADLALPTIISRKFKINVFKEMFSDPGSNVWSKDYVLCLFSNQNVGWKNHFQQTIYTVYYTDS